MNKFFIVVLLLWGCSSNEGPKSAHYQEIEGRSGEKIYRIQVPLGWRRVSPETPPKDTKVALCEFFIDDPEGTVRITLHNFPSEHLEDRVPPGSQIARWKRQLNALSDSITPQSFSGYVGFLFEGDDDQVALMGWIMQMGTQQYSRLALPDIPDEWRADVTIKAQGPLPVMQKYRQKIITFSRSFELIHEIPK